jgi:hypothetical protein
VGISKNAIACKENIAKKTVRPPILSERAGQRSLPTASVTEIVTTKAAARAVEAPPIEAAIGWASERIASPAVVLRKNTAQRAYNCHVFRASRKTHMPLAVLFRSDTDDSPSTRCRPSESLSSSGYRTNQAVVPMRTA